MPKPGTDSDIGPLGLMEFWLGPRRSVSAFGIEHGTSRRSAQALFSALPTLRDLSSTHPHIPKEVFFYRIAIVTRIPRWDRLKIDNLQSVPARLRFSTKIRVTIVTCEPARHK